MLDGIGNVHQRSVNRGVCQAAIEQLAGWPNERAPFAIFFVARLLADKDNLRRPAPFAKHGLRRVSVKIASPAALHSVA